MNRFAKTAFEDCKGLDRLRTAVVHPVKASTLQAVAEGVAEELITPVLVGPGKRIEQAADEAGIDIAPYEIIDVEHSHDAAAAACAMAVDGTVDALMKGALHTAELLHAAIAEKKLRTERRLSHVYAIDIESYHKPFLVTDGAINIAPDLAQKADIVQNAIYLWTALAHEERQPKVAALAAVETVMPSMQATIDAACLAKMADRGQITGAELDGPFAFDNAISREAADNKGIRSTVAGDPDILLAPDLEAGNILAKQLTFLGGASAAATVLGARVPVILTSRADSVETRLLSIALAVKIGDARRNGVFV